MESHLLFELPEPRKIHLGITGSIAAYKAVELMRLWQKAGIEVSVTLTESAQKFITPLTFESLGANPVYKGMFDEPLSHLAPSKDANAMIIAPASADTIAQLALGRADTLLAAQALAFDKPIIIAPAMNPRMWKNEATQNNVRALKNVGIDFVGPVSGKVACNDEGEGRLASEIDIYLQGLKAVVDQDFEGKTVLVTLGATQEKFDDIRIWTNKSTGMMGMSLAIAAWLRGAHVHAIASSSVQLEYPNDDLFEVHRVVSAENMFDKASEHWYHADYGIFTAAVADFRPKEFGEGKFKKSSVEDDFSLEFYPNKDILKSLAKLKKEHQKVIGFAAEYASSQEELADLALKKMYNKNTDIIIGNALKDGFATSHNKIFIADKMGRGEHWPQLPKPEIAWNILSWLLTV